MADLTYLQRRYGAGNLSKVEGGDEERYTFRMRPTDPDLVQHGEVTFQLRFSALPADESPIEITAVKLLPPSIVKSMNELFVAQVKSRGLSISQAVKFLDGHGSTLLQAVIAEQEREYEKEKAAKAAAAAASQEEKAENKEQEHQQLATSFVAPREAENDGNEGSADEGADGDDEGAKQDAPPSAPKTIFEHPWSYVQQAAFERALRETFFRPGASLAFAATDKQAWKTIAALVNKYARPGQVIASNSQGSSAADAVTPAQCLARFIVLRKIVKRWTKTVAHASSLTVASSSSGAAGDEETAAASTGGLSRASSAPTPEEASAAMAALQEAAAKRRAAEAAARAASTAALLQSLQQANGGNKSSSGGKADPSSSSSAALPGRVTAKELDAVLDAEEKAEEERAAATAAAGGRSKRTGAMAKRRDDEDADGSEDDSSYRPSEDEDDDDEEETDSEEEDDEGLPESFPAGGRRRREHHHHHHEHGEECDHDHDHDGEEDFEDDEEDDAGNQVTTAAAFSGIDLNPQHKGYLVRLDNLSLFGIGTLACSSMDVTLQCERCNVVLSANLSGATRAATTTGASAGAGSADASAAPSTVPVPAAKEALPKDWKAWCPKCSLLLTLSLRPTLVHEGNPGLGYIDSTHATVTSLNNARLISTCLECGAHAETSSGGGSSNFKFCPPCTWEASCRTCYSRLRIDARGSSIELAAKSNTPSENWKWRGARDPPGAPSSKGSAAQKIQPGKPLPHNGTCKHYGQSYRWLRFPCCGIAFPCDVCHNAAADHSGEFARRMICGFCAREQPFSSTNPCVACGRYLTRNAGPRPRFWEGGLGQRDRRMMSSRDPRKFKGSELKTKSKKSQRVGAAAKAQLAAKMAAQATAHSSKPPKPKPAGGRGAE